MVDVNKKPDGKAAAAGIALGHVLGGALLGLVLVLVLDRVLDGESKATGLWHYGRYALVALLAWCGQLVGSGRGRVVAENVECLAIAVVMALILKHFLVEAYKIPTGSMQPTILGSEEADGGGIFDRVLVNKFVYLLREPERYDVVVFKYPLDRSKNYIKRLIGLSGERVSIFNGNIYTATRGPDGAFGPDRIARKPRPARDAVLKRLYPSGRSGESFTGTFERLHGDWQVDGDDVRLLADTTFRYGHGETIRDRYLDGYDPDWGIPAPRLEAGTEPVGDLAIALDIEPDAGCREVELTIFAFGREHRAVLGVGTGGCRLESGLRNGGSDALLPIPVLGDSVVVARRDEVALEPGETARVAFYHVDQELVLEVDGDEVLTFPYEVEGPLDASSNAVEVAVRGGSAQVADVEVFRDIHYTTVQGVRDVYDVPDDALFVLGDNTQNSSDGRMWSAQEVRFADGRSIITAAADRTRPDVRLDTYVDIYGEKHRVPARRPVIEVLDDPSWRFVPRRLVLGKALAVFWPVYPHFRWKLLR